MNSLLIRNKNAIIDLLENKAAFEKICLVTGLKQDDLTQKIVAMATKLKIPVNSVSPGQLPPRRGGDSREVIVGYLLPPPEFTLKELISNLYRQKIDPFFLLLNRVEFENNIGLIARTALAAGVNGLIYQGDYSRFINSETIHFSVGSIVRLPLVRSNIFEAIKELNQNGIPTYSLEMEGKSIYQQNLTGPIALVMGGEARGVSDEVSRRCHQKISIPMKNNLESLNVAISAALVLYEKVRQETGF